MADIWQELAAAWATAAKVTILGCGSSLRGDDAAGTWIAEQLLGQASPRLQVLLGDTAPENQSGVIKAFAPDLLLVIDSVDQGLLVGELTLVDLSAVTGASFSSHILPLPVLLDYLGREIGCRVLLLGMQIGTLDFLADLSPSVRQTAENVVNYLRRLAS
ncbi:MAG: hydrogenase 3 maturation endopeptidase HyCI [Actinomycetia bacterium]|nr:hydrogenase 3 maturation endopeptidase HyCI [Actinomycetes bacterium]